MLPGDPRARPRHDADDTAYRLRQGGRCDFGLPPGVQSYAILPIGWPMGRFGKLGRGPLKDVVFQDKWGQPYKGL